MVMGTGIIGRTTKQIPQGEKYRRIGRDDDGNEKHLTEFQTHNGVNMDDRR